MIRPRTASASACSILPFSTARASCFSILPMPLSSFALLDLPHDDLPARLRADLGDPVAHQAAADDTNLADLHIRSVLRL